VSDPKPPDNLLAALLVGGIPLLMGAAALYFTSGVTFRCDGTAPGQVSCAEGRRFFKLLDVPLRRYADVRGAVTETRIAYDSDGDKYQKSVAVILTAGGRAELLPAGEGAGLGDVAAQVDAYAKRPVPDGLVLGSQPGGLFFFFHLFSAIFVYLGLWNLGSYVRHVLRR